MLNMRKLNPQLAANNRKKQISERMKREERAIRESKILSEEWACLRISDDGKSYNFREKDPDGIMANWR